MKKIILLLQLIVASTCFAAQYKLIDGCYSTVGNYWNYNEHYTRLDSAYVNISGTESMRITGTRSYGSYSNALIMNITSTIDGSNVNEYYNLTPTNLLQLGLDDLVDTWFHVTYRNNNPLEMIPVLVDTSYNNYHFGYGQYTMIVDGYGSWYNTMNTYITYLRNETITVPAGIYDCVTVLTKMDYYDDFGVTQYIEDTSSYHPSIGLIKSSTYHSFYDPDYGTTTIDEYTLDLVSTNVTLPPPSIAKDKIAISFEEVSISETFQIFNDGTGTLNYNLSIIEGGSYFSILLPTSGSSTGSADKNLHTVTLDRDNVDPNQIVSGKVMITSAGADDSPQYIDLSAADMYPNLNDDDIIAYEDFGVFSDYWMDQSCSSPGWCQGSDFNKSGAVDFDDLLILCDYWLVELISP